MSDVRKLCYYIATTMDGRIAGPTGEHDFFPFYEELMDEIRRERPETIPGFLRERFGLAGAPNVSFDTVVMGRGTYDPILPTGHTSPYPHLEQIVFSRSRTSPDPSVVFTADDPVEVVRGLKRRPGKGIWLCGGGKLAAVLVDEIDEVCLKLNPMLLGAGLPLLDGPFHPRTFRLAQTRTFTSGLVYLRYLRS